MMAITKSVSRVVYLLRGIDRELRAGAVFMDLARQRKLVGDRRSLTSASSGLARRWSNRIVDLSILIRNLPPRTFVS